MENNIEYRTNTNTKTVRFYRIYITRNL